jgi:hypothetical protein
MALAAIRVWRMPRSGACIPVRDSGWLLVSLLNRVRYGTREALYRHWLAIRVFCSGRLHMTVVTHPTGPRHLGRQNPDGSAATAALCRPMTSRPLASTRRSPVGYRDTTAIVHSARSGQAHRGGGSAGGGLAGTRAGWGRLLANDSSAERTSRLGHRGLSTATLVSWDCGFGFRIRQKPDGRSCV